MKKLSIILTIIIVIVLLVRCGYTPLGSKKSNEWVKGGLMYKFIEFVEKDRISPIIQDKKMRHKADVDSLMNESKKAKLKAEQLNIEY